MINKDNNGLALSGYDVVSYFDGKPRKADGIIFATHKGVLYQFISQENKAKFEKNPDKYLPQYGGYCATAMSEGKYVPIHPKHYKITDGKLYLFYKGFGSDPKPEWDRDEKQLTQRADKHWKDGDAVVEKFPTYLKVLDKIFFPDQV